MSIFHKYYQGDGEELKKALKLCGISVGCVLGCESSIAEIEDMAGASLNIVTDPLYGLEVSRNYEGTLRYTVFGLRRNTCRFRRNGEAHQRSLPADRCKSGSVL